MSTFQMFPFYTSIFPVISYHGCYKNEYFILFWQQVVAKHTYIWSHCFVWYCYGSYFLCNTTCLVIQVVVVLCLLLIVQYHLFSNTSHILSLIRVTTTKNMRVQKKTKLGLQPKISKYVCMNVRWNKSK